MKIQIDGKEYGLTWGIPAVTRYAELMDMELEPALDLVFKKGTGFQQAIALSKFICCAIDSYALIHNGPTGQVTPIKILAEFDDKGNALATEILDDFLASKLLGQTVSDFLNLVAEVSADKTKKKPQQVKS